jgi:hypothetical protein
MFLHAVSTDHRHYAPRLAALGTAAKFAGTLLHASGALSAQAVGACFAALTVRLAGVFRATFAGRSGHGRSRRRSTCSTSSWH